MLLVNRKPFFNLMRGGLMQTISSLLRNKNAPVIENTPQKATSNYSFNTLLEHFSKPTAPLSSRTKTSLDMPQITQEKAQSKRIDEHLLSDLLHISESLKMKISLPLLSFSKAALSVEKLVNNQKALEELRDVKHINDIVTLAKKYDLGLEKLTITPTTLATLEKSFPLLGQNNFFKTVSKPIATPTNTNALTQAENAKQEVALTLDQPFSNEKAHKMALNSFIKAEDKPFLTQTHHPPKREVEKASSKQPTLATTAIETPRPEISFLHKNPLEILLQHTKVEQQSLATLSTLMPTMAQDTFGEKIADKDLSEALNLYETLPRALETSVANKHDFAEKTPLLPKETLTHFTHDLKELIQAYKPPIMKVELALHPENLGEVDVTLLTRGNHLVINIGTNQHAIGLFSQHQAEFKQALFAMGFSQLEMNFSQQKNQENTQRNDKKNNYKTLFSSAVDENSFESNMMQSTVAHYL